MLFSPVPTASGLSLFLGAIASRRPAGLPSKRSTANSTVVAASAGVLRGVAAGCGRMLLRRRSWWSRTSRRRRHVGGIWLCPSDHDRMMKEILERQLMTTTSNIVMLEDFF